MRFAITLLALAAAPAVSLRLPSSPCGVVRSSRRDIMAAAAAGLAAANSKPVWADKAIPQAKIGVTPGGVKYFDKEPGSCSPFNPCVPQAGDIVKIKYKAYLSNGQMFDSSDGPGRKPLAAKYKANPPQMLPGWEEALETMEQGSTRIIQVPPALAYGDKGIKVGDEYLVPPNERLQYELTLVQVALPPP